MIAWTPDAAKFLALNASNSFIYFSAYKLNLLNFWWSINTLNDLRGCLKVPQIDAFSAVFKLYSEHKYWIFDVNQAINAIRKMVLIILMYCPHFFKIITWNILLNILLNFIDLHNFHLSKISFYLAIGDAVQNITISPDFP